MDTMRRVISGIVIAILVLASIGLALLGADRLTQATVGVGTICGAVFIAVLARICQAADHHAELRRLLERGKAL